MGEPAVEVEPSVALAAGWQVDKELGKRIPVRILTRLSCYLLTFDKWYPDLMLHNPDNITDVRSNHDFILFQLMVFRIVLIPTYYNPADVPEDHGTVRQ
jgi:hypothetical protein